MLGSYKFFPIEETSKWNSDFSNATKSGDKVKIMSLLNQADKLYLDEYFISNSISDINSEKLSDKQKEETLSGLKKCKLVKDIVNQKNAISIKTDAITINFSKLSDIIPSFHVNVDNKDVLNKSEYRCQYISQVLGFPNSMVTGYIYGIADKSKSISTWLEFKNKHNQEFVVFPDSNTVYNKEGFYFLKHAEPIKKVSSDDLKGKGSVNKSNPDSNDISIDDIEIEM